MNNISRAVAALNNTKGVLYPLLNQLSRDKRFIAHYPCRYDCPDSVRMAESLLRAIGKDLKPGDPDWKTVGILFADGVNVTVRGEADGMNISYKGKEPIRGDEPNFIELLRKGNQCRVENFNLRIFSEEEEIGVYSRNCEVFIYNWGGANVYPLGFFNKYLDSLKIAEPAEHEIGNWAAGLRDVAERAAGLLNGEIRLVAFHAPGREAEMKFEAGPLEFRLNALPAKGARNIGGFYTNNFIIRKYLEDEERCKTSPALAHAISSAIEAIIAADPPESGKNK
jgi:hypothetical protein